MPIFFIFRLKREDVLHMPEKLAIFSDLIVFGFQMGWIFEVYNVLPGVIKCFPVLKQNFPLSGFIIVYAFFRIGCDCFSLCKDHRRSCIHISLPLFSLCPTHRAPATPIDIPHALSNSPPGQLPSASDRALRSSVRRK